MTLGSLWTLAVSDMKKRKARKIEAPEPRDLPSQLEGMHYTVLQNWVDNGTSEELPKEMLRYLEQLDLVNRLWNSSHSPQKIISKLVMAYPELNQVTAKSRFEDAATWFYLDDNLRKQTWRNMIFEKQLQLADATIRSAVSAEDYDRASRILERASKVKALDETEVQKIPDDAFAKPINIFSLDVGDFTDLPQNTDRNLLGRFIDDMNLEEEQKLRIKQDAGIERKTLFEGHVPEQES